MDIQGIFSKLDLNYSFPELSSSFLLGFSIGYFFKKSFKLIILILGIILFILFWFDSISSIRIVNDGLSLSSFNNFLEILKLLMHDIYNKISNLRTTSGFAIIVGFLFGLKLG